MDRLPTIIPRNLFMLLLIFLAGILADEFLVHGYALKFMSSRIDKHREYIEELQENLAAKYIEFHNLQDEKNKWIFEVNRLKAKLYRCQKENKNG